MVLGHDMEQRAWACEWRMGLDAPHALNRDPQGEQLVLRVVQLLHGPRLANTELLTPKDIV